MSSRKNTAKKPSRSASFSKAKREIQDSFGACAVFLVRRALRNSGSTKKEMSQVAVVIIFVYFVYTGIYNLAFFLSSISSSYSSSLTLSIPPPLPIVLPLTLNHRF